MKLYKISIILLSLIASVFTAPCSVVSDAANMYQNSDFIETEQPELSDETKKLISLYQKNPTEENYLKLREIVIQNYNAVLDRKEAKLAELKDETDGKKGGAEIVAEMEEIVQEMYITYWSRINSSMLRFTDTRLLRWVIPNAPWYEYIPVMGAGESIYIKRTPVTNAEYAEFVRETGVQPPSNWTDGDYIAGEDDYPVNFVSYEDAVSYCAYLTEKDGVNTYRMPNESEWELAAGHMPKDADFNCGVNDSRTPVDEYSSVTRGAHGAVDFWGNVWEWTSTVRSSSDNTTTLGVKGGSWKSERTDCRTEYRKEGRDASLCYEDVGFRVIQVKNGTEPEQKVELATLLSPALSAISSSPGSITLSWTKVDGAAEYQLFEYFEETNLVQMLDKTKETNVTISGLEEGSAHRYIVQPISYVEIADNVAFENSIRVIASRSSETPSTVIKLQAGNPKMIVNGVEKPIDNSGTAPVIVNDRTLLPVRALVEEMGGTVDWMGDTKAVKLNYGSVEIILVIDALSATVNGVNQTLDTAPIVINGRTMLPVRFIAENFGFDVDWNEKDNCVTISRGSETVY